MSKLPSETEVLYTASIVTRRPHSHRQISHELSPIRSFQAPRHTPVISRPKQERPPRLCSANANYLPNCRSHRVCKTTPFLSCRYKGPLVCLMEPFSWCSTVKARWGAHPQKRWVLVVGFCFVCCFKIRFLSRVISVKAWALALLTSQTLGHVSSMNQFKNE